MRQPVYIRVYVHTRTCCLLHCSACWWFSCTCTRSSSVCLFPLFAAAWRRVLSQLPATLASPALSSARTYECKQSIFMEEHGARLLHLLLGPRTYARTRGPATRQDGRDRRSFALLRVHRVVDRIFMYTSDKRLRNGQRVRRREDARASEKPSCASRTTAARCGWPLILRCSPLAFMFPLFVVSFFSFRSFGLADLAVARASQRI